MSCVVLRRLCGLGVALIVSACETNNFVGPGFSGAVVTVVDSGPALQSARTFALPDTIVEVPSGSATIGHAADREIIEAIREHFLALGWHDASRDPGARPDVIVLVAAATHVETGVAYTDWYGGWGYLPYWGAGVDPSWGWGVPAGAIPYSYQAGTLVIAMLDLRAQSASTKTIPMLWAAALDGIVSSPATTAERVLLGVDQAFAQSAYLRVP